MLLNLFFPGAGHFYVGQTQTGVTLLVIYVVCFVLIELVLPALDVLGIWTYALTTSSSAVYEHNARPTGSAHRSGDSSGLGTLTAQFNRSAFSPAVRSPN